MHSSLIGWLFISILLSLVIFTILFALLELLKNLLIVVTIGFIIFILLLSSLVCFDLIGAQECMCLFDDALGYVYRDVYLSKNKI